MCREGMFGFLKDIFCVSMVIMVLCSFSDIFTYQEKLEVVRFFSFFFLGSCLGFGFELLTYVNTDNVYEMNKERERKIDLYVFS